MIEKSVPTTIFDCTNFLFKRFSGRSGEEQELVVLTLFAAAGYHGEQRRLSGEPYIIHPLQVACFLAGTGADLATVQAGLLHDVLEDTEVTSTELVRRFGEEVYGLVNAVSRFKMFSKREFLEKVYAKSKADPRIAQIKIADQCSNHLNGSQLVFDPQAHLEHLQEHEEFFLNKIADIPDIPKELVQAFHRIHADSQQHYDNRKK